MAIIFFPFLLAVVLVQAIPAPVARDASYPVLTSAEVVSYNPYTYYAKAVYCGAQKVASWSCGPACDANRDFVPTAAGGDGDSVQYWYVGYDRKLKSVIVAHQGTNKSQLLADLTDLKAGRDELDKSLFPNIPDGIDVHSGFKDEHAKTALTILTNVQSTMSKYGVDTVTCVGHSLGAAIALLDSVFFRLNLPFTTSIYTTLYGLPRVGNQKFADYVDRNLHLNHINNKEDPIPTVPGMFMGYVHPGGEIHIQEDSQWIQCPGQDNPSSECIVGDVPSIWKGNEPDHDGPYNGIMMHCKT